MSVFSQQISEFMYIRSRKNYFITQLSLFLVYMGMISLIEANEKIDLYYGLVFLLLCFIRLLISGLNKILLVIYVISSVLIVFFDDTLWFLLEAFTVYRETALEHWLAIGVLISLFMIVLWLSIYSFFIKSKNH